MAERECLRASEIDRIIDDDGFLVSDDDDVSVENEVDSVSDQEKCAKICSLALRNMIGWVQQAWEKLVGECVNLS